MKNSERIKKWQQWKEWVNDFPKTYKIESHFDELGNYRVELYTYDNDRQKWAIEDELEPINYHQNNA